MIISPSMEKKRMPCPNLGICCVCGRMVKIGGGRMYSLPTGGYTYAHNHQCREVWESKAVSALNCVLSVLKAG